MPEKRRRVFGLKKGEKLSLKDGIAKAMPFASEKSLQHLRKELLKGTTSGMIQKHLLEKYPVEVKLNIGSKEQLMRKTDNLLGLFSGRRGAKKPRIGRSEGRYPDPAKGGTDSVFWWAESTEKADKAGKAYAESLGKEARDAKDWGQVERYKDRLLNKTTRIRKLKGEPHERIFQKAMDEIVKEMMEEGKNKRQIIGALSGDRSIMRDFLDMEKIERTAKINMGEILKRERMQVGKAEGPPKEEKRKLDRKAYEWIYERHLAYEMDEAWKRKIEEAISRKKGGAYLLNL